MDLTTKIINNNDKQDTPNAETITAIETIENNHDLSRSFSSVEELFTDLNSDD